MNARLKARMQARTGQRIIGYDQFGNALYDSPPQGTILGMAPNGTYRGSGGPGCGPGPQTVLQSHGAACPPGDCPPGQLATALGRQFAGERSCRELTYWARGETDGGGALTVSVNSLVTMCPTRLVVVEETPLAGSRLTSLNFANVPQMIGDPIFLAAFSPQSVQAVPFVMNCLRAGLPFSYTISDAEPDSEVWLGFIGPMSG